MEFFDDLYSEKYADSITHIRYQVETISGLKMLKDCQSEFYNVKNGERYTYGSPKYWEKTIYFVGPCYIYGHHTEDKYTIESFLQKRLNKTGYKIKVVNCGSIYSAQNTSYAWMRIKSLPLRKGDIIVYGDCRFDGITQLNLLNVCKEHNIPAKWMTNAVRHCNHKINSVYADAIYDALTSVLAEDVLEQGKPLENKEDFIQTMYIERYFKDFIPNEYSKVGTIVMNCNPFTYGHRYLIEQALEQAGFLIIFVVEEDRSLFSFNERFAMVYEGVRDLNNVKVVPSGPFILSQTTFPEYFIKTTDEELIENVENDIRIFGERIAPYLNIKYRFVGDEPEDIVTNEYNLAMKRILPKNGIELVEIPRKEQNGKFISASLVRKCLEEQDLKKLEELVPESVRRIIFERNY
ncbi:MAG: adenylyltransferase/cytidyltransferase family protein [Lachnospiraceae bacterium]|nr:adenylyltransferase/cytidyltransferase family protein [Lachnospiraceae bacterium]